MNRIIVSVFDNEEKAFKGQSALKELHISGDISLFATSVISKNEAGKVEMKSLSDNGPLGNPGRASIRSFRRLDRRSHWHGARRIYRGPKWNDLRYESGRTHRKLH